MNSRTNPAASRAFSGNGDRAFSAVGGDGELWVGDGGVCWERAAVRHCSHSQAGQDTTRRSATPSSSAAGGLTSSTVYKLSAMISKAILTWKKKNNNSIFLSLVQCSIKLTRLERQTCPNEYWPIFLSEK